MSAWTESYRRFTESSAELKSMRFLNPDGKLHDLIQGFNSSVSRVEYELTQAAIAFIDTANSSEDLRREAEAAYSSAYEKLFDVVRPINNRLEQLLEGQEVEP